MPEIILTQKITAESQANLLRHFAESEAKLVKQFAEKQLGNSAERAKNFSAAENKTKDSISSFVSSEELKTNLVDIRPDYSEKISAADQTTEIHQAHLMRHKQEIVEASPRFAQALTKAENSENKTLDSKATLVHNNFALTCVLVIFSAFYQSALIRLK